MALKITNEFYDLIDTTLRDPNVDVAVKALGICRAHIQACHLELTQLRADQRQHERQLAERDQLIAALRADGGPETE